MERDSTAVSDHDAVGGLWNCDESQIKLATVAASLLKCANWPAITRFAAPS